MVGLLEKNQYDTDDCTFQKVDFKKAEDCANMGGFAIAVRSGGSHGHIATLVGGYKDNVVSAANVRTYQPGTTVGYTNIKDGFGKDLKYVMYYIWRRK